MALVVDSPSARYGDLCRLCATKTGLTPKGLNIFANEANYRQIFKKIEACLPLQISQTDPLPKVVCENCLYKVELLFDFRERALRTEGVLIEVLKQLHSHPVPSHSGNHHTHMKLDHALDHVISQQNGLINDGLAHVNDIELPQLSHRESMIILAQHSVPLDQLSQHDINQELSNHSIDTSESILGSSNGYSTMEYHHASMLHDDISLSHANIHQMKSIVEHEHDSYAVSLGVQKLMMNEAHFMHNHLNDDNLDTLNSYMFCTTCGKSFDDKHLLQQHIDEHFNAEKELENARRKELHESCVTLETHEQVTHPTNGISDSFTHHEKQVPIIDTPSEVEGDDEVAAHLNLVVESEVKSKEALKSEQYSDADSEIVDNMDDGGEPASEDLALPDIVEESNASLPQNEQKKEEVQDTSNKAPGKRKTSTPKICNVCGKQYKSNYKLTEHMRKHTGEQPYKCTSCDKGFRSKIGLAQHEATHTGQFEFSCSTCGKGFQCKSYLMVHQRVHSDVKPFPCTTCDRSFKTKQTLLDHTNRHLGLKPYACDICCRSFITNALLKAHKKIHTGADNRKYACPFCGKMFVSKSYLQTHTRIHTGDKPFKCEVCGKGFLARVDLKVHTTLHTGEKSYVCEMCGKAFARRDALRCHRRSHTGERPYKCDICGQTFTQFSPMAIHKRLHTGERPYACEVCGDKFVSRSTMMVHFKKHVKNEINAT